MITSQMSTEKLRGWLVTAFTGVALVFCFLAHANAANPTPDQLRDQFDAAKREIAKILRDIETTQSRFQASYACPPSETKKQDQDDLNQINGRINAVAAQLGGRGRRSGIAEQNEALGTAGEGQGLDRYAQDRASANDTLTIPESMIAQALRDIQTARTNLGRARQDLNSRPKTERECNARFDPIGTITWSPGTGDPGAQINSVVSATTRSGKAVTITAVTANVSSVSTGGANIGGMGAAVNVGFKIDDVKRQGPHTLTITVTGRPAGMPASAGTTSGTHRVTGYMVNNVAPTVTSLPTGPEKEPGEELSFDGQLVVVDRNADNMNANELTAGKITFQGHPPELDTNPGNAFQTNAQARKVGAHDPTTGSYTFEIRRKANAKKPHKHGKFPVTLKIEDKDGKSVTTSPIDVTIKNVAPVFTLKVMPKRKYHSGDGIQVVLSGTVRDDNGKDDIEKIEVDATAAGGALFTKANGKLVTSPDGDSGYTFVTNPDKFNHPNSANTYPIPAFVEDNGAPEQGQNTPEKGTCNKDIEVGNDPPRGSGSGYIYDREPGNQKRICPNELFTAGAIFVDDERDRLAVKGQIGTMNGNTFVPVGPEVPMAGSAGSNTYTAQLKAPAVPGTYIIRFSAVETNTNPPKSASQTIELVVDPCPGEVEETAMTDPRTQPPVEDEDKPEPPALCGTATVQQQEQMAGWATGFWDWLQQSPASDTASAPSGATGTADAAITPADTEGGLDYAAVDENWGLSLGVKYGDTQMFTMKLNPLINYSDYTVGLDEDAGSFDVTEAFRDLNIPVVDGTSLPSLLDFGTFSPAGGGATGSTPGIGAFGTSLFGTVGPGGATNYMPRAPSIGELFGGDLGGSIFTDGFESGDTSAWSSGVNGAPARSAGNGVGAADSLGSRVRLNFDTSFTGQDVLRTRLEATRGVSFVEDGFCRQALRPDGPPTTKAQFRQPAPPVEDFLKDPNAMRTWDPATDGAQPRIGELNDDGSNLPQLLNQYAPNYRCGQPLEISLADSLCNTATTTVGR